MRADAQIDWPEVSAPGTPHPISIWRFDLVRFEFEPSTYGRGKDDTPTSARAVKARCVHVGLVLGTMFNSKTLACWASFETLAELSGLSPVTCKRAVHDLKEAGFLFVTGGKKRGAAGYANYYKLRSPGNHQLEDTHSGSPGTVDGFRRNHQLEKTRRRGSANAAAPQEKPLTLDDCKRCGERTGLVDGEYCKRCLGESND